VEGCGNRRKKVEYQGFTSKRPGLELSRRTNGQTDISQTGKFTIANKIKGWNSGGRNPDMALRGQIGVQGAGGFWGHDPLLNRAGCKAVDFERPF